MTSSPTLVVYVHVKVTLSEGAENNIRTNVQKYITSIKANISNRFPATSTTVLNAFSIFNVEVLPSNINSETFRFYGDMEVQALAEHFFADAKEELVDKWGNFKHELVELKRRWSYLKRQVETNKLIKMANIRAREN